MPRITRRNLLAKTGTGMAAAGVLGASPGLLKLHGKASNNVSAKAVSQNTQASGKNVPSVVYIRDAAKGEVVLMIGSRQIVRTDRSLVAYLSNAASETA